MWLLFLILPFSSPPIQCGSIVCSPLPRFSSRTTPTVPQPPAGFSKGRVMAGGTGGGTGGGEGLVERLLGGRGCCPWGRSRGGLESHLVVIRVLRTTVTHGRAHSPGPARQSITSSFSMYTRHCASCNDTALSHTHTHTHTPHTHTWTPGYTHLRGNCT